MVSLEVTLRGDLELLRRIVALGSHLAPARGERAGRARVSDFTWTP